MKIDDLVKELEVLGFFNDFSNRIQEVIKEQTFNGKGRRMQGLIDGARETKKI